MEADQGAPTRLPFPLSLHLAPADYTAGHIAGGCGFYLCSPHTCVDFVCFRGILSFCFQCAKNIPECTDEGPSSIYHIIRAILGIIYEQMTDTSTVAVRSVYVYIIFTILKYSTVRSVYIYDPQILY